MLSVLVRGRECKASQTRNGDRPKARVFASSAWSTRALGRCLFCRICTVSPSERAPRCWRIICLHLALLEHPGYLAGRSGFLRQSGLEMLATNLSTRPTADIPRAHSPYLRYPRVPSAAELRKTWTGATVSFI